MESTSTTLAAICRQHKRFLRRALLHLGVPYRDLDDVLQDLLVSVDRTLHTYQPGTCKVTTWLYSAAWRHARGHRRRETSFEQKKVAAAEQGVTLMAEPPLAPDEHLLRGEMRRCLYETLDRMKPSLREVLEYREFIGLSFAEIAALVRAPETTVRRWHDAALAELKAALEARFGDRSRRGAAAFPIGLAMLLDGERQRLGLVPAEDTPLGAGRLLDTLAGLASAAQGSPLAEHDLPSHTLSAPPPSRGEVPRRWRSRLAAIAGSRVTAFVAGGAAGAALVWFFLRMQAPPHPPGAPPPEASVHLAIDEPSKAVAPALPVTPAASTTPSSVQHSSPLPARLQVADEAATQLDEGLIRGAREAIRRHDFDEARQLLLQHARQYPTSKLRLLRVSMLASLPQTQ